jgi:hypothetical protein
MIADGMTRKPQRPAPIPREEPDEGAAAGGPAREPTTLRPPRGDEADVSTYQKLRDSCRVAATAPEHEAEDTDTELAIEAAVVQVALGRGGPKSKPKA